MALVHHHPVMSKKKQNRCAVMFCLTWVGFFVLIGVFGWVLSAL